MASATLTSGTSKGATASTTSTAAPRPLPPGPGIGIQNYNDLQHMVDLYIETSGTYGGSNIYQINPATVIHMDINKNLLDWVVTGELTFMYIFEDGETSDSTGRASSSTPTNGKAQNKLPLSFRADGFDLLRVMIRNVKPEGDNTENAVDVDGEKDTRWTLSYLFSICDIEDVDNIEELRGQMGSAVKCLKIKFKDVRYQILKNSNLQYSTAQSPQATEDPQLFQKKALFTGDLLLEIFNKALTDPMTGGDPAYGIVASSSPGSSSNWDKGMGKMFYTSPAAWSALDDIQYVAASHVSAIPLAAANSNTAAAAETNGDLCVLHTKRPRTPDYLEDICLTPLATLFQQAGSSASSPGKLQYEHFFVQGDNHRGTGIPLHKAPLTTSSSDIDLKTQKYGQILSYSFVDMSPDSNSDLFHSTPVCSSNIRDRLFNVEFSNNSVTTARQCIADNYIKPLFKQGDGVELFAPQIHKSKLKNNIFPTFTLNSDNKILRQKNGLHQLLYTGLFHNLCICFRTLGLTLREPGTFIGIDEFEGAGDSDYSNKLFGQWFVTTVNHIFEAGSYMNEIYAIKLHRFKVPKQTFTETIDSSQAK